MPSYRRYHQRRAAGLCPTCGGPADQPPYVQCSQCYTPKPLESHRHLRSKDPDYYATWTWQHHQQTTPAVQVGCCGRLRAVTQVPFRTPCCGRVFGAPISEESV